MIVTAGVLVGSGYAAAQSCTAPELPDQDNLVVDGLGSMEVTANQSVAQTFTVGMAGLLTRVEMTLSQNRGVPTEDLVFDLVTTDGTGAPTTTQIAHVVLPPSAIPPTMGLVSVELTSLGISVSVGEVLAIVLSTNAPGNAEDYGWRGGISGSYARGASFTHGLEYSRDMAFRTFVCSQDAIPTVSAWGVIVMTLLLLTGIAIKFGGRQPGRAWRP